MTTKQLRTVLSFFVTILLSKTVSTLDSFLTSGELRVAVDQFLNNESEVPIARYGPISEWNVSLVEDMSGLFQGYEIFNENITLWDTRNVVDMSRMFRDAKSFAGELVFWNTKKVTSFAAMFHGASSFNSDISAFDTSAATDMSDMFRAASSFNADISFWNVSQVRDISTMFWEATSFNVDLSKWNIKRMRQLDGVFLNATGFAQTLCWVPRENALVNRMFCGSQGSFDEACICEHDLYYDDKCVRPSLIPKTTCDPDAEISAATTLSLLLTTTAIVLTLIVCDSIQLLL